MAITTTLWMIFCAMNKSEKNVFMTFVINKMKLKIYCGNTR